MNTRILTAALLLGFAGFAAPAMAAQRVPYCDTTTDVSSHADDIALQLQGKGINVQSVDDWNGCARAFVTRANGHTVMEFFDPDTLAQVGTAA